MVLENQFMQASDESSATWLLLKYLRNLPESWRYKIPDIWRKTKPFDIVGLLNGQMIVMELKYINLIKIHPDYCETIYRMLEPHQASNLYKVQLAGGTALIWWYIQATNRFIFYPFSCHQLKNPQLKAEDSKSILKEFSDF